ncbi:hypothetical protein GGD55_003005 [Rhizobium giardinii]|uniref:DNA ligase (ATP) n=1 Tax=Rhizobium giardinii TaxID=56731 RepID=A0A7W8XA47_9HYPH|nr:hypothetical protein [Rhizobium giardinii]
MDVGYEQSAAARGGIGSLLLAARRGHDWAYVGSVGTGFNTTDVEYLCRTLNKLKTPKQVVPLKGKNLVFVQPTLIAESRSAVGRITAIFVVDPIGFTGNPGQRRHLRHCQSATQANRALAAWPAVMSHALRPAGLRFLFDGQSILIGIWKHNILIDEHVELVAGPDL